MLAEIDADKILSQSSDCEMVDILNWMKDEVESDDEELADEEESSQQECIDILYE